MSKLKIVNIKNIKFEGKDGYYMSSKAAWAFKNSKGFLSYDGVFPYVPQGGKKTAQSIIDNGGFLNYDGMHFIKEM